jgi:hypothetical protein
MILIAWLLVHSSAFSTLWQGKLLELAEILSFDIAFQKGSSQAPLAHQPQLDPDTNQDSEMQKALRPYYPTMLDPKANLFIGQDPKQNGSRGSFLFSI